MSLHCDKCCGPVSKYNPYRYRCHACIARHGPPDDTPTVRNLQDVPGGHRPGCACRQLRRPTGAVYIESRGGERTIHVIDVTCPDCGETRELRTDGVKHQLCWTNYIRRCQRCGQLAAAATRTKAA